MYAFLPTNKESNEKYQVIYKDLEKAIHSKEYQVGDFLPTEQELVETFQVSRDTIRKALALLVEEGLVKKIHGSGSQVISQEQVNFPVSYLTSYQELIKQQGIKSQTNVISLDKIIVDTNLSEKTGFSKSQQVWRLIRQRVVDGCASVVDIDYQGFCLKEITIDNTAEQDKILIDIGKDHHVVCIRSKVYLDNGNQFQFTESRHKLEKFKFVDYAKRHH